MKIMVVPYKDFKCFFMLSNQDDNQRQENIDFGNENLSFI